MVNAIFLRRRSRYHDWLSTAAGLVSRFRQGRYGAIGTDLGRRAPRPTMPGCIPAVFPLKKSDFRFDLPVELIAQAPLAERSASRLLVRDAHETACAKNPQDKAKTPTDRYRRRQRRPLTPALSGPLGVRGHQNLRF